MTGEQSICRQTMAQTLLELASTDSRILVLTSDSRGSAALEEFARQLPEQLVEVGIAEQNEVGIAAGMALSGAIPFVCAPAAFISARALEQIKIDVCGNNANVKLCGVSGGLAYAESGESHMCIHDIGALSGFHNLTILMPSDSVQTKWMIREIAKMNGPVYIRMGRNAVPDIYEENSDFEIGRAVRLTDGEDLTIIATGEAVHYAISGAQLLAADNIHARVVDMHTIKPIDRQEIIAAAADTGRILTVEEHMLANGLGVAVASVTAQECPVPVRMIGVPDEHIVCASALRLQNIYGLSEENIYIQAKELLQGDV